MKTPDTFFIHAPVWDAESGLAKLHYSFDQQTIFTEEIDFGIASDHPALETALIHLSVAAGISYYKAFVPKTIIVEGEGLSEDEAAFFTKMYQNGLGEFACRNEIDMSGRCGFIVNPDKLSSPYSIDLPRKSAVLVGGGKDSLVSIEMLRAAGEDMTLFAVNPKKPILDCIKDSGLPAVAVHRSLDPQLFALNEQGAYNGHVPITGILSFISVIAGMLHGFDTVILSNERSANEGNVEYGGTVVNHQYSKSLDFERDFQDNLKRNISPDIKYFSLLRQFSELHIAQLFARVDRYDGSFTSCNRSFKIHEAMIDQRWCRDCPKCRFVFLALATAMPKARLLDVFGGNMLDDESQLEGFRELSGLSGHKPWECVGEIRECASAILQLSMRDEWNNDALIKSLAPELAVNEAELLDAYEDLLTPSLDHALPEEYEAVVRDYAQES